MCSAQSAKAQQSKIVKKFIQFLFSTALDVNNSRLSNAKESDERALDVHTCCENVIDTRLSDSKIWMTHCKSHRQESQ